MEHGDSPDGGDWGTRREVFHGPPGGWPWLAQLRLQFDLAIEVLDTDLEYVLNPCFDGHPSVVLRERLAASTAPDLTSAATRAMRSAQAQRLTIGGARIHLVPLYVRTPPPSRPAGVLVIADARPGVIVNDAWDAVDRRLDGVARWLAPAVEASLASGAREEPRADPTAGIVDIVDAMTRMDDDREITAFLMDAIALWFDADVRVYREDASGAFALVNWLPAADPASTPTRLEGHQLWARDDVFTLESAGDLDDVGWNLPATETVLVPIVVDESVAWLLVVTGANPASVSTLGSLGRITGALLTVRQMTEAERFERRLITVLTFGDAPFSATLRNALDDILAAIGATTVQLAVYYQSDGEPALAMNSPAETREFAPYIQPGAASVADGAILVGAAAGGGVTVVLRLACPPDVLGPGSVRLARTAAATVGVWLSGALLRAAEPRAATDTKGAADVSADLTDSLGQRVDRLGRLSIGGALAVVESDEPESSQPSLDQLVELVREHTRPTDVVGLLGHTRVGVLLPGATRSGVSIVTTRLRGAASEHGVGAVRTGAAVFEPLSERAESLVQRAVMNARFGSAP